ncbi:TALE protein [Tanacetum coccineum]
MAFLLAVASRFPSTNNQLRTSSNPRNQDTIQDGIRRNDATRQGKVIKCYNCQGEGYMARQCTRPKRPRNYAWFQEKLLLVQAQENGYVLDKEQLAFLADPGIHNRHAAQTIIQQNAAFQTKDLDAYNSDCDDVSSAKAVLMANLSCCDSDVLFEVPYTETYQNDLINDAV